MQEPLFLGVQAFANKKIRCGIHRTTMTLLDLRLNFVTYGLTHHGDTIPCQCGLAKR